ncbi:MAG TPA: DUF721 domain-containing protein [Actinomycetota bacterium]|nr:DUF721 domain-containing protein [Actinomycetota bacterium]
MSDERDPRPIKDVIAPVARRLGVGGAVETSVIWGRWVDLVGDDVAAHAEPTSLRDGVLRVRTDTPVWATEIGYLAAEIRRRVNAAVGSEAVREVRVWTGPGRISEPRTGVVERRDARGRREGPPPDPAAALERARRAWRQRREPR